MTDRKPAEGGFFKFLWNSDTGEFLGRTGISWFKIIVFYIIFYAGLAAFFGLLLYIFYTTLDIERPKYTADNSLIGTNPGVGFRPQPDQDSNVDSTLIWFKKDSPTEYKFWSDQLDTYVKDVKTAVDPITDCGFQKPDSSGKNACKVETEEKMLGPCNEKNQFGYKNGEPCVLIKLNRIYDWKPEPFGGKSSKFDLEKFNEAIDKQHGMPIELKEYIRKSIRDPSIVNQACKDNQCQKEFSETVWISCAGENPADRENIGELKYYPMPGIPTYYFPFQKQSNYKSPFIMVHFAKVTHGVLINIECKAWAANIHPDRTTRTGSVHFELMID